MAIRTSSLVPFSITSIPDRLTPIYIADKTKVTTTTGGTGAFTRLNRVQGAQFTFDTPIIEVSEMGAQTRVGGVDELGEVKFKLDFNAVSTGNLAALCGKSLAVSGTLGVTDFQNAQIDIFRMVADPLNNIFGTLYMQDCILTDYTLDIKEKGVASETVQGMGPNALWFPGFVLTKTYVVQAGDVVSNVATITIPLGADEAPVQIYTPGAGNPASYWQQYGASYLLKIEQIPAANLANAPVRYYESGATAQYTATYTNTGKTIAFPNNTTYPTSVAAGDLIRVTFLSYNADSLPTSVPASTPDTTDRAGITARLTPITINTINTTRVQSAQIKYALKRDHVQGLGETSVVYGVPAIPDVQISFDVKESDPALVSLLTYGTHNLTGSGGAIQNDFGDLNYVTRKQLATALPFSVVINDPFNVGTELSTYSTPQLAIKSIDYASSNKADNTIKITAEDIQGSLTITRKS